MFKNNKNKIISFIICFLFILPLISLKSLLVNANVSDRPDFDIEISTPDTAIVGEDIVVSGKIIPKPFEIPIPPKEIVLVVDSATNDNGTFNPLINGAKNFIQHIGSNENFKNIKIGVVDYSKDAEIKRRTISNVNTALIDASIHGDIVKGILGNIKPNINPTNTGEALRKAAYLLNSSESSINADKTIILISDSEPTARTSYIEGNKKEGYFYTDITKEYYENASIFTGSENDTKSTEYAKVIGEIINSKGYNVFTIGYSADNNSQIELRKIHEVMSGRDMSDNSNDEKNGFFITDNKNVVESTFSKITDKILNNYELSNINMNIDFTDGFSLNIAGNTVNLSNVNYKMVSISNGKVRYEADPISFEFVTKADRTGYQKIFDKISINYPWQGKIETVEIRKDLFITIKSNELPNITAKLISEGELEVKNNEEITINYEIRPEDFTSSSLNTESGKIEEAIFITDLTQNMKNGNRFSILQNSISNKILSNNELELTKFGVIGYSDSVSVGDRNNINDAKNILMKPGNSIDNLLKPLFDISEANSKDGFRQLFQNGHLYNSISNTDTRNIDEALIMAKDIFNEFGNSDKRKAIILINSGLVNYSKDISEQIKQEGYKIISLDLSATDSTNLKNLHVDLGGRINDVESYSDFLTSRSDGGNFNFGDSDMSKVAERLIDGIRSESYSSITPKMHFDLNNNFEYVDGSTAGIKFEDNTENVLSFSLMTPIKYSYSGSMENGKYRYTAPKQVVSFKVKVKSDKEGKLKFGDNSLDKLLNYMSYLKFNNLEEKVALDTPTVIKQESKINSHGLYNGISGRQVIIEENNNEAFILAPNSTVTLGSELILTGNKANISLNIDSNLLVKKQEIKIYKIVNNELSEIMNKDITDNSNNNYNISVEGFNENEVGQARVLVVYRGILSKEGKAKIKNTIAINDNNYRDVNITTTSPSNESLEIPDLF